MAWTQSSSSGFHYERNPQSNPRRPDDGRASSTAAEIAEARGSSIPLYGQPFIKSHGELQANMREALRKSREPGAGSLPVPPGQPRAAPVMDPLAAQQDLNSPIRSEAQLPMEDRNIPQDDSFPAAPQAAPPVEGQDIQQNMGSPATLPPLPAIGIGNVQPEVEPPFTLPTLPGPGFLTGGSMELPRAESPAPRSGGESPASGGILPDPQASAGAVPPTSTDPVADAAQPRDLATQAPQASSFNSVNWFGSGAAGDGELTPLPILDYLEADQEAPGIIRRIPDHQALQKLYSTVARRMPERVLYTKGAGVFGNFTPSRSMAEYTAADFLARPGEETRVLLRISPMLGRRGTPDTLRGPIGLAFKLYTQQGNCDILTLSLPIFMVQDASRMHDLMQVLQPAADTNLYDREGFWDFVSQMPETVHFLLWMFGDEGLVKDFGRMNGYSYNTFVWQTDAGEKRYVRYHMLSKEGPEVVDPKEALWLAGSDPDHAQKKLYRDISGGTPLQLEFAVQMMDLDAARRLPFDPLNPTVMWPVDQFPLTQVGEFSFNQVPDNYETQVEQSAFHPANLVPGIALSQDRLLQGMLPVITMAQQNRLGVNPDYIPVNAPLGAVGGTGRMHHPQRGDDNPRDPLGSLAGKPAQTPLWFPSAEPDSMPPVRSHMDVYTQASEHFRNMDAAKKARLFQAVGNELAQCSRAVQNRQLRVFHKVSPELGMGIKQAMGDAMAAASPHS